MQDPLVFLARQRVINASRELEKQLENKAGGAPAILILDAFRERAAESMVALATVDPNDPEKIRTLQNDVMKYDEVFEEIKKIITEGHAYEAEADLTERDEALDLLTQSEEGTQQAIELGLIDDPTAARG